MSHWILKVTGAQMPASCRARYSVVRVLEVIHGTEDVSSIRSKAIIRVVYQSKPVPHDGTAPHSGMQVCLAHARDLIARRREVEKAERDAKREIERRKQEMICGKLERGETVTAADWARF